MNVLGRIMTWRRDRDRVPLMTVFARAVGWCPRRFRSRDQSTRFALSRQPRFLRSTHYLVVGLFVSLLMIAAFTNVDVVVVASGRLATATPPIVLQPMERAIVRELRVHPGDVVTKGEVLATLDPTFAEADTAVLEKQLRMLRAQVRRLEAEADGREVRAPMRHRMMRMTCREGSSVSGGPSTRHGCACSTRTSGGCVPVCAPWMMGADRWVGSWRWQGRSNGCVRRWCNCRADPS